MVAVTKLTASDGAADDRFGFGVGLYGDYAIIGAFGDDGVSMTESGSAYIFVRDGTSWSQQAKLTASDAAQNDAFGRVVGIYGDYAIVGSHSNDDNGTNSGAAYIFVRDGTSGRNKQNNR